MNEHRILLRSKGMHSWNEDWWSLIFQPETGQFFVEHEWNYLGGSKGEQRWTLTEARTSEPHLFAMAIARIETLFRRKTDDPRPLE